MRQFSCLIVVLGLFTVGCTTTHKSEEDHILQTEVDGVPHIEKRHETHEYKDSGNGLGVLGGLFHIEVNSGGYYDPYRSGYRYGGGYYDPNCPPPPPPIHRPWR